MAIEIERKFLLKNDDWKALVTKTHSITQGYLQTGLDASHKSSVRIRISDDKADINIKSVDLTMIRQEFEYEIPLADAKQLLSTLCDENHIIKTRYHVPYASHVWEIDIFEGANEGLRMAEIELDHIDEDFEIPDWIAEEVSDDERYYNIYLINTPYKMWL